jgi:hypothetical protein
MAYWTHTVQFIAKDVGNNVGDLTMDMYMHSFVCRKEVSVDERKVARLQRISCFKLAVLDPIWHFIMGYLIMFITYAVILHTTMYVL